VPLPKTIDLAVVKNTGAAIVSLYFYDSTTSIHVAIKLECVNKISYYVDARAVLVSFNTRLPLYDASLAHVSKLIRVMHTLFMFRLRVIGRLYRIYKRNIYRDLMYRFGHSHKVTLYTPGVYIKYIRKKQLRIIGADYAYLSKLARSARDVFPQNIYTNRGIRLGTERFYAKMGKVLKFY